MYTYSHTTQQKCNIYQTTPDMKYKFTLQKNTHKNQEQLTYQLELEDLARSNQVAVFLPRGRLSALAAL